MFEAMRIASFVSRVVTPDMAGWLATDEVLRMATEGSAQALGWAGEIGRVAPGYFADIVFLDLANINFVPLNDATNQIVHSEDSSAVESVMVGGRMVLENGHFTGFDYAKLRGDAEAACERLRGANAGARALAGETRTPRRALLRRPRQRALSHSPPGPVMADATVTLGIDAVAADYPAFRVAFAVLRGMRRDGRACPAIDALVAEAEALTAERLAECDIAALAEIADWRVAYRSFGIKKTSYRNACEALLRRLRGGAGLPRVLPLVDLYNALSVKYLIPVGADDVAALAPPLAFRYARPGDSFHDLAGDPRDRRSGPSRARSCWPTPKRCCAGAGTGARTRAAGSAPRRVQPPSCCRPWRSTARPG